MTGLASRVSAICFSSASSGVPSTSRTKCLPWRTPRTPSWPSRPRAPSTACPWGSEISGLRTTSTTTRGTCTRVPGPIFSPDRRCGRQDGLFAPRPPMSSAAQGRKDLRDHLVGAAEDVSRGEAEHGPAGRDEAVLATHVVDEDVAVAVDVAVELDQPPLLRPGE